MKKVETKKIVLKGRPLSTNTLYKSHCRFGFPTVYMTKEGKDLKEEYSKEAKQQWKGKPIDGDVAIRVEVYHDTKRKNDIDNFNKILFDSLTGIVWVDDQQVQELTLSKRYDKENPRIELIINEI